MNRKIPDVDLILGPLDPTKSTINFGLHTGFSEVFTKSHQSLDPEALLLDIDLYLHILKDTLITQDYLINLAWSLGSSFKYYT